jgi:thiamine pyrophosphate-dependent acetolactate synthase large subunit-like protein
VGELTGGQAVYVDHPDQVGDALRAALSSGSPAVVEIPIDPEEFPAPATAVRRR